MDDFKRQLDELLNALRRLDTPEARAANEIAGAYYRVMSAREEFIRIGQMIAEMRMAQYPPQQMAPQQEPPDPEQLRRWHEAVGRPHPGSNGTVPHYHDDRVG